VEDIGVKFNGAGVSGAANVELTPMPMINIAMASVHAAVTTVFETAL